MTYPNTVISMPSQLFTMRSSFKAVANGSVYIGEVDTDPTIPTNQIQVYIEQENGTLVPVAQPIKINSAGFLTASGQVQKFVLTNTEYSMTVQNSYGVDEFYFPRVYEQGISAALEVEERLLGPGAKIYRGSNGQYVQNGDVVPSETPPYTHLAVQINGKAEDVAMSPIASGLVSDLTETSATIGGAAVLFHKRQIDNYLTIDDAVKSFNLYEGMTIRVIERILGNGGGAFWRVVSTSTVSPNGFDIVQSTSMPTLSLQLDMQGIVSAKAIGCVLDSVTDDFNALSRLHSLGVSYSLDGETAYCSGTLEPKSGQTIYPFGGGIRKDTAGYLFSSSGAVDRFIIEHGGLFSGDGVADFINMDGAPGYGNGWTNCEIDCVGTQFVTAYRISNARRCVLRGRMGCKFGLVYANKSAENEIQGLNFVGSGESDSLGIELVAGANGYPEGLVMLGGMVYGFARSVYGTDILEVNFSSTEFNGTVAQSFGNRQIQFVLGSSGVCRGIYFDSGCHISENGIKFGDGTATTVEEYRAIINGASFRSMKGGSDIEIAKFARNVSIANTQHECITATNMILVGDNCEGITINAPRPRGAYTRYVNVGSSCKKISCSNIVNTGSIDTPFYFGSPVQTSNLDGYSNVRAAVQIPNGTYAVNANLQSVSITLSEGNYVIPMKVNLSAASGTARLAIRITSSSGGVIDEIDGGSWNSEFMLIPDVAQRFAESHFITVTNSGTFVMEFYVQQGSVTTSDTHGSLGVFKL